MDNTAKNIMARKIITIRNMENLLTARTLMTQNRIRHIPVINEAEEIVGIVSSKETAMAKEFPHVRVEHVMSSPVEFVTEDSSLRDSIYKMLTHKISSLVVVNEKQDAVGIFTADDLLLYLAQILEKEEKTGPWWDITKQMTVGQIMRQLSMAGI